MARTKARGIKNAESVAKDLESSQHEVSNASPSKEKSKLTEPNLSKNVDVLEVTNRSSRSRKVKITEPKKPYLRSQSATIDSTTTDRDRNMNSSRSQSKPRKVRNRSKPESVDPIMPKIEVNSTPSLLRYPKVGESTISLSGSPVISNGVSTDGIANIAIPIANGMLVMKPTKMRNVDANLISRIDNDTLTQLKQIQVNLSTLVNSVKKFKN